MPNTPAPTYHEDETMSDVIRHVTARTCPLDPETGTFQSTIAEAAFQEAVHQGLCQDLASGRIAFQQVLQAHNAAEDRSKAEYAAFCEEREAESFEDLAKEEPIMKFFAYAHLPEHLRDVSRQFAGVAKMILFLPRNAERTTALRKLLESKDCAVRSRL